MVKGISSNPEPKKPESQSVVDDEGKNYSIFDNAPQDGTVSTQEQETAFLDDAYKDTQLVAWCKNFKINISEFFRSFRAVFDNIETDGTKQSASSADQEVKQRILAIKMKLVDNITNKQGGTEKEPPSILTQKGFLSDDCIEYMVGEIVFRGLELDENLLLNILDNYDYNLSGDDSVISTKELRNIDYNSQFMNHDFDGNIKDTHVLDFVVNKYEVALKNRGE